MESTVSISQSDQVQRIVSTVLHHIDVDNKKFTHIPISNNQTDLEGYLSDLLSEIKSMSQKRAYSFHRETTEFFTSLKSYYIDQNLTNNKLSSNLANRLLDEEVDTDNKYGHLGSPEKGHVKKGSFLQFLYRNGTDISYLGVKVEHQLFLDERDFKQKIGLSVAKKIYKACQVTYDSIGNPNSVFVYDTNSRPTTYWWKKFLELKEIRDDRHNTKTAADEVIRVINRYKKEYPSDYTILRNSVIAAFKQQGEMKYDDFVRNTFENYEPEDPSLKTKLPQLVNTLRELPEKKKFDTHFTLVPSEVPFKRSKVALTKEISLSIDDGIENLDNKIWSEKSADGKYLVVIDSPEGFKQFKQKERT